MLLKRASARAGATDSSTNGQLPGPDATAPALPEGGNEEGEASCLP